jgi:hypothetical protein
MDYQELSNIKVLSNDHGIRPAGRPDECFYCHQKVGSPHKLNCVCLHKRVKARYTYEIEVDIPYWWDDEMFEFYRNESSWCASNSLQELESFYDGGEGCACDSFQAEFLGVVIEGPFRSKDE